MAGASNGANTQISNASSSNLGSPTGSGPDLDGMGPRSGSTTDEKLDAILSKFAHFETQLAQVPAITDWMSRMESHMSKTLGEFASRLAEMETIRLPFLAVVQGRDICCLSIKCFRFGQVLAFHSNKLTALQPLGPMALDHPTITEIQDVDLTRLQTLMTNKHAAPFYHDFHASNISLELRSGSITSWKRRALHHTRGQPGSTVMHVPYRPDLSLKQELSVKNLWPYFKMMASLMRSTPFCVLPKLLSWFAIQDQLKNVKLENNYVLVESFC